MTDTTIPVVRAQHYVHEDDVYVPVPGADVRGPRDDGGIIDLAIDRLGVDHGCVEPNRVTISARGPDRNDAYGFEFDLEPGDARRLAAALIAVASAAEADLPRASRS